MASNTTLTWQSDLRELRQMFTKAAHENAERRKQHAETIMLKQSDGDIYFWPEQTTEEAAEMKQYLVDRGLAEWVIPR